MTEAQNSKESTLLWGE